MNSNKVKAFISTEASDGYAFADYLKLLQNEGKIQIFTKIAHETYTKSWMQKQKNTRSGLVAGFPDYVIVVNDTILFLELKRSSGGVVTPAQKTWLLRLDSKKTKTVLAKGFWDAKKSIDDLLAQ